MAGEEDRQNVAKVTPESLAGYKSFAERYSSDMTALAETIGLYLARLDGPIEKLPPVWRRIAEDAKRLRVQRKARPQKRPRT